METFPRDDVEDRNIFQYLLALHVTKINVQYKMLLLEKT